MLAIYLYFNSVIYAAFAVWCILKPQKTSDALGYLLINSSGKSEYLVVYGALQLGLAAFFLLSATRAELQQCGLLFSLCLYIPLFIFRIVSFFLYPGIGMTTIYTAILEAILTVSAVYIFFKR